MDFKGKFKEKCTKIKFFTVNFCAFLLLTNLYQDQQEKIRRILG